MTVYELKMLDIVDPDEGVEVGVAADGKTLWVNVDGICRLRVSRIRPGYLSIEDARPSAVPTKERR